jgi:hypothetical protein
MNMDQDKSLGQLYDVQIRIKIFYTQSGWAYSFSTTVSVLSSKNMNHDKFLLLQSISSEASCCQTQAARQRSVAFRCERTANASRLFSFLTSSTTAMRNKLERLSDNFFGNTQ